MLEYEISLNAQVVKADHIVNVSSLTHWTLDILNLGKSLKKNKSIN